MKQRASAHQWESPGREAIARGADAAACGICGVRMAAHPDLTAQIMAGNPPQSAWTTEFDRTLQTPQTSPPPQQRMPVFDRTLQTPQTSPPPQQRMPVSPQPVKGPVGSVVAGVLGLIVFVGILVGIGWAVVAGFQAVTADDEEPSLEEQCQPYLDRGDDWINEGAPLDGEQPNDAELRAWYQCRHEFG